MPQEKIFGTLRPNLVVVFDNEKRFEFRVQCEVPVSDEEVAMKLVGQLQSNKVSDLITAKTKVLEIVDDIPEITKVSRSIIAAAFDACRKHLEEGASKNEQPQ